MIGKMDYDKYRHMDQDTPSGLSSVERSMLQREAERR